MTQPDDAGYDLTPKPDPPKPGEPGWVPPVPVVEKAVPDEEGPNPEEVADVEKNKGMAILAYICFLIPLVAAPNSGFARFHANQGLLTFIFWCAAMVGIVCLHLLTFPITYFLGQIAILYYFFSCIAHAGQFVLLILAIAMTIFGIIQAANGEKKSLPYIGTITLIK